MTVSTAFSWKRLEHLSTLEAGLLDLQKNALSNPLLPNQLLLSENKD